MKAFSYFDGSVCRRSGTRFLYALVISLLLLPSSLLRAQHVELNLVATDTLADSRILSIGVDPAATDNIDPSLGEYALGPLTANYEARLIGDDIGKPGLGLGTYRDFRGIPGFQPFTLQYELLLKPRIPGTTVLVQWSFPPDSRIIAAQLRDRFNIAYNVDMLSTSYVQIRGGLQRFILTLTFDGLVPNSRFALTTLDVPPGAGITTKFPDQPDYAAGQSVTLTASPISGYRFVTWTGDTTVPGMPILPVIMWKNKTIAAFYEPTPPPQCTITTGVAPAPSAGAIRVFPEKSSYNCGELLQFTAEPANCWKFLRWSGDTVSTDPVLNVLLWRNRNIVAEYVPDPPTLDATPQPSYAGYIIRTPDYPAYACGDVVTLRAFANPGYQFIGWEGDTIILNQSIIAVPMYKARRLVARFCNITTGNCGSVITVETSPPGLQFMVDGVTYTNAHIFVWQLGEKHEIGVPFSMQTQLFPNNQWTRYRFQRWNPQQLQPVFEYVVNAPSARLTARFTKQHALVTENTPANAGQVSVSPPSPDGFYDDSTNVLLTAVPNPGWRFLWWTGDILSDTTNPKLLLLNAPKRVRANYTNRVNLPTTAITLITSPPNLSVVVDGTVHQTPATFRWLAGEQHEIGVPAGFQIQYPPGGIASGTRFLFVDWDDGKPATHMILVTNEDRTYRANFQTQHLLTTGVEPLDGGTVNVSPPAVDGYYNAASSVTLRALPAAGYRFDRWTGNVSGSDTLPDLRIVMNTPRNITARFEPRSKDEVPVNITSIPPGLTVVVDGATLTTPASLRWLPDEEHTISVPSAHQVQYRSGFPKTRYRFSRWNLGPQQTYVVKSRIHGQMFTAAFEAEHQLVVETAPSGGGTVTLLPDDPEGFYREGARVQLSAVPAIGYRFLRWNSPDSVDLPAPGIATTLWKPKTFRAMFEYTGAGRICLSPKELLFESCLSDESLAVPQILTLQNCGYEAVRWNTTITYMDTVRNWLMIVPDSGFLLPSQSVSLAIRVTRKIPAGNHPAEITLFAQNADNPVTKINILHRVSPRPHFEVSPSALRFTAQQYDPQLPPTQALQFADYTLCPAQWSVSVDSPWVQLSQTGGAVNAATISVGMTRNDLPIGLHTARLTFESPQADNTPIIVALDYEIFGAGPDSPDSLTAEKVDDRSIYLQWKDYAFNEDGFHIERQDPETKAWTRIGTTDRNQASFLDKGLDPCKTYAYRVRAYNESGVSDYSNVASATTCRERMPLSDVTAFIYPNPVTKTGTFSFTLSKAGDVTIRIVDASNAVRKTLKADAVSADECNTQLTWDGTNDGGEELANGVYFFIIETSAGERAVGKIALLK